MRRHVPGQTWLPFFTPPGGPPTAEQAREAVLAHGSRKAAAMALRVSRQALRDALESGGYTDLRGPQGRPTGSGCRLTAEQAREAVLAHGSRKAAARALGVCSDTVTAALERGGYGNLRGRAGRLPSCTIEPRQALDAVAEHGSARSAARALGVPYTTFLRRLATALVAA
jgi:hypothetical protein